VLTSQDENLERPDSMGEQHTDPRTAYSQFKNTIGRARLKDAIKTQVLNNFVEWKKNSHVNLFWARQQQALAIRNGKVVAGTSLVAAATDELPDIIRSEASRVCHCTENERTIFLPRTDVADSLSLECFPCVFTCTLRAT
jgi:hypothetical protein